MRLWYFIIPVVALTGVNKAYDAWRSSPPSAETEARRQCFAKAEDAGLPRVGSIELCNCMIGKVRWFKWTSFGAEYTREIHHKFGEECVAQMTSTSANESFGSGTFGNGPANTSRPLTGPGSGYGEAPDDEDDDADEADRTSSTQ